MKECLLPRLLDPRLSGLPGLKIDALGYLVTDEKALACCAGSGARLSQDGTTTTTCRLAERLKKVRTVAQTLDRVMAPAPESPLPAELKRGAGPQAVMTRLAQIAQKQSRKGFAGNVDAPDTGPSVWAMAFAAAWRFGLTPHVVIIGKTPPSQIIPTPGSNAPDVIFVGNVDKLWEAPQADALEALIGYAYSSLTPLFLEFVARRGATMGAVKAVRHGHVGDAFSKKLRNISGRPLLSWLPPPSLSKLADVTDGVALQIAAAEKDRGRKKAPKKSDVTLPWD